MFRPSGVTQQEYLNISSSSHDSPFQSIKYKLILSRSVQMMYNILNSMNKKKYPENNSESLWDLIIQVQRAPILKGTISFKHPVFLFSSPKVSSHKKCWLTYKQMLESTPPIHEKFSVKFYKHSKKSLIRKKCIVW